MDWTDPKVWIPIAACGAAWIGAALSIINARRAGKSLLLQEEQEARRRPNLAIFLDRGYYRKVGEQRVYSFLISIMNRSDNNNSIARLDLKINYRSSDDFAASVNVPALANPTNELAQRDSAPICVPIRIDAHQTVIGWVYVQVNVAMLDGRTLDDYSLIATDVHGGSTIVDSILLQEVFDET